MASTLCGYSKQDDYRKKRAKAAIAARHREFGEQGRQEQVTRSKDLSLQDRQQMARAIGENPGRVGNQRDMGALSGRDDSAGGSGDRMEGENTGEGTDRY